MNADDFAEKRKTKPRFGLFRIGEDSFLTRDYVYIPSACLKNPNFHMAEIFEVFGVDMPNILFRLFQTSKPKDWNVCLPHSRQPLINSITDNGYDPENPSGPMQHYHGVLRENCRRLLRSTGLACKKAGAGFRLAESWSPEARHDAVASWITEDNKASVMALGCADFKDFAPTIWQQLDDGAYFHDETATDAIVKPSERAVSDKDVIIDPSPFYNDERVVTRDELTQRVKGSFPHPNMTHLLISDNRELLEKKLAEVIPWGLIMVNGSPAAADFYTEAALHSQPTILFQHTGYTTDMAVHAYKKAQKLMAAKKLDSHALAQRAYPDNMPPDYHQPRWLQPFDESHRSDCQKMNVLLENWPSKFKEDSVFVVDMFSTTEDELQDRLTQTMGVVFAPQHEVGGHMSENKRLTFAWRTRAKYMLNARRFKRQSDILTALLTLFTLFSTLSAVTYTFINYNSHISLDGERSLVLSVLLKSNLLLPLAATLFRGMISMFNPMMKYVALKNAAVRVEMEIYQYRTKVGKYSFRKPPPPSKDKKKQGTEVAEPLAPRQAFAKELDVILNDLTASDIQNGSLTEITNDIDPLADINRRISQNRTIQEGFSRPMLSAAEIKQKKAKFLSINLPTSSVVPHHVQDIERGSPKLKREFSVVNNITGEYDNWYPEQGEAALDDDDGEDVLKDVVELDDGLSLMTTDDYLTWRLLPMMADLSKKTPSLSSWSSTFTICILLLSISAAALTTFDRSDFIPAALAVSGGVTAWANYQQTDLRLVLTNNSLQQLNQLMVWWDGLTMIEKRIPMNKETLVKSSELSIISQATVVGGAQSSSSSGPEEDNKDGEDKKD